MGDVELLLTEIREMRKDISEGFSEIGERVTRVETRMYPLFDNGQPGELTRMRDDIQGLKEDRWKALGFLTACGVAWELLSHWAAQKLGFN